MLTCVSEVMGGNGEVCGRTVSAHRLDGFGDCAGEQQVNEHRTFTGDSSPDTAAKLE